MGRQTRRALSQYELAAQEQIRERNAEQAGQIREPELPSVGTARVSALLAEAQRQREEAWRLEAQRERDQALLAEARRQVEEAQRQVEEARLAEEAQRQVEEAQRQPEQALLVQERSPAEEPVPADATRRGGGSRWSEIVLERRSDLGQNPLRPETYDLDLPSSKGFGWIGR